jgi:hypothetical protein
MKRRKKEVCDSNLKVKSLSLKRKSSRRKSCKSGNVCEFNSYWVRVGKLEEGERDCFNDIPSFAAPP